MAPWQDRPRPAAADPTLPAQGRTARGPGGTHHARGQPAGEAREPRSRGELLGEMWRHWAAGDRARALTAIPDEVIDDLVVHGTPDYCRRRIYDYVRQGVTIPIILPLPVGMGTHEAALRLAPKAGDITPVG
ncbi:LLM class flavin-dependent oxidoreductase [Streptomyces sp. NPDC051217]|uniref:LLM class flavin-dependent oxidoreductase n=1 Tax=Streptomyces sp. NPDC051217 TaxID=3365644 RepID=UPI0037ABE3C8